MIFESQAAIHNQVETPFDRLLFSSATALLLLGFVMVTSASLHLGDRLTGDTFHYPKRQLIHIAIGLVVGITALSVPLAVWQKAVPWLLLAGGALLVLVLIPGLGIKVNGSRRWLALFGLRVQIAEIVKLISILYLALYSSRQMALIKRSMIAVIRPLLPLSLYALLLLMEPDFGSAAIIMMTALGILFIGGAQLRNFALLLLLVAIAGVLLIYTEPYRMARLTSFMDPWADPLDKGFQLVQALIALGRGGLLGVGLGSGIQKLFYLPEAHTDFLLSVIGEELGLIGVVTIILLFAIVVWRTFYIAARAEEQQQLFGAFIAYGIGIWFGLQAFINIGVNMGLLPTKGLTLPLMSYGGGSMIIMCCALGLLFRVHRETIANEQQSADQEAQWLTAS